MTVSTAPLSERDFFGWYALLAEYAADGGVELDDARAMRVWTRLQGPDALGAVAKDAAGAVVGLVHVTAFERLVRGDAGYELEDLYVTPSARGDGVATALVEHVRGRVEETGLRVLRWPVQPDDEVAKRLWDRFAAVDDWMLQDLTVG